MIFIILYILLSIAAFIYTIYRGILEYKNQRLRTKDKFLEILFTIPDNGDIMEMGYFWSSIGLSIIGPFTITFFIAKYLAIKFSDLLYSFVEESEKK